MGATMNEQFILGFCYGVTTSLFAVWLWWEFSAKKRIEREKKHYCAEPDEITSITTEEINRRIR